MPQVGLSSHSGLPPGIGGRIEASVHSFGFGAGGFAPSSARKARITLSTADSHRRPGGDTRAPTPAGHLSGRRKYRALSMKNKITPTVTASRQGQRNSTSSRG